MCIRSPFTAAIVAALAEDTFIEPQAVECAADFIARLAEPAFVHPLALVGSLVKHGLIDDDDVNFRLCVRAVGPICRGYVRLRKNHGDLFTGMPPAKQCQHRAAPVPAPLHGDIRHPGFAAPQSEESVMLYTPHTPHGDTGYVPTDLGRRTVESRKLDPHRPRARKSGNGDKGAIMRGLKSVQENAAANTPEPGYFAEIRTQAGKVKFRTDRAYGSAALAATVAFQNGPEWARECITYTGVVSHRR
jgi:hypothetical protein